MTAPGPEARIDLAKIETIVLQGGLIKGLVALQLIAELRAALAREQEALQLTESCSTLKQMAEMCIRGAAAEQALAQAREALEACLNMVDGDGAPPNWDAIREVLKDK